MDIEVLYKRGIGGGDEWVGLWGLFGIRPTQGCMNVDG